MNTIFRSRSSLPLLAAAVLIAFPGCKTVDGQNQLDVDRVARIAGAAAQLGSQAYLIQHPEHRPSFEVAYEALSALDGSGNYDPAAFAAALSSLPIKELQGPNGNLYIAAAILVWDELAQSAATVDTSLWVKPVLRSVREGLGRTLGK